MIRSPRFMLTIFLAMFFAGSLVVGCGGGDTGTCTTNSDCKSTEQCKLDSKTKKRSCVKKETGNKCESSCSTDDDCKGCTDGKNTCTNGACSAGDGNTCKADACSGNADCAGCSDGKTTCNNGKCEAGGGPVCKAGACGLRPPSSTEQEDTTPSTVTKKAPPLISAFFGLDSALPYTANRLCPNGTEGKDGMPVVFPLELDIKTLQAGDFRVQTRSGKSWTVYCVTPAPALDPGEVRTLLLIGEYGSKEDPPTRVSIVGNLLDMSNTQNFKGHTIPIIPLEDGPTLVLAQNAPKAEWSKKNMRSTICPGDSLQVVRVTWAGGVTRADGKDVGEEERKAYSVTLKKADGSEKVIKPFALADLNDGDNNHDLCLDQEGTVTLVSFQAGLLVDPRGDVNPKTQITVTP